MNNLIRISFVFSGIFLMGCISNQPLIQQISQCSLGNKAKEFEKEIYAERGFKRFTQNTYKPVIEQTLFGHKVRVVSIESHSNKIYVAGNPTEFKHHFTPFVKNIECTGNECSADLNKEQNFKIYKAKAKKSKDTTVIECTKPVALEE